MLPGQLSLLDAIDAAVRAQPRKRPLVTGAKLKECFCYYPDTGDFIRLTRLGRWGAGTNAGSLHVQGYIIISIDKQLYKAHRLAWLYVHGEWPTHGFDIDHINGNRADNRITNLRLATRSQNNANSKTRRDNISGSRGVSRWHRDHRWRATINGRHLGLYETKQEAQEAYSIAARQEFGDFWFASIIEKAARERAVVRADELQEVPSDAWDQAVQGGVVQRCAIPNVYFSRIHDPRCA